MKTKTLLLMFSVILSAVSFSQDIKQSKEIYFEGTVVDEWLGDGAFFITIKITKGDLIGTVERLYFSVGFDLILIDSELPYDLYVNSSANELKEKFVRIFPMHGRLTKEDVKTFKSKYYQLYIFDKLSHKHF